MRRTVASSKWPVFTCPLLAGFARPMTWHVNAIRTLIMLKEMAQNRR